MKKLLDTWSTAVRFCGAFLLLGLASTGVSYAQDSGGVLISPLNRTIQGRTGGRDSVEFNVSNTLKTSTVIGVSLRDLTQDASGSPVLGDPGTTPQSASPWISLKQGNLTVAPGQTQKIRVNVTIPQGVSGSYQAGIVLQLFAPSSALTGSAATVVNQTILPIYVFIGGTVKPAVELQSAELKTAPGNVISMVPPDMLRGKWVLVPKVKNTGNSLVRLRGDVVVTSVRGELVGRYQINEGDPDGQAILPGATVAFPIFINSTLPDEKYPARVSLRFQGTRHTEGYSAPVTLEPRTGGAPDKGAVALGTIERTGLQALVDPSVVIGNVQPGSLRTQRITVTNLEDFPVDVTTGTSGLAIDLDGETIPLPDDTTSAWMSIAPSSFRLGAQQSRIVSVRMNAPTDTGDRWGMLQFSMVSAVQQTSNLTANARTTVLLRNAANTVDGVAKAQKVALVRSQNGLIMSVTMANGPERALAYSNSLMQLVPANAITPADVAAGTVTISGETNIVLLPSGSRRLDFQLPGTMKPLAYQGTMVLKGLSPSNGGTGTADFQVPFKLDLSENPTKVPAKTAGPSPLPKPGKITGVVPHLTPTTKTTAQKPAVKKPTVKTSTNPAKMP